MWWGACGAGDVSDGHVCTCCSPQGAAVLPSQLGDGKEDSFRTGRCKHQLSSGALNGGSAGQGMGIPVFCGVHQGGTLHSLAPPPPPRSA